MESNRIEIKDTRTLTRLLRNCYYIYAYVVIGTDEGRYIKLQKTDLMSSLIDLDIDLKKFTYDTSDNTIWVDSFTQ